MLARDSRVPVVIVLAPSDALLYALATAGSTVTVGFSDGSFTGGETVSIAVSGSGTATLSVVKAATATISKTATAAGAVSVKVALPTDATGSYSLTATGATSGLVGTSTITIVAADAGSAQALASTGYSAPIVLIWGAAGALFLGIALVVVLSIVRRQRANA
ncbi:hypothetical protein QN367_11115 [Cryobacterium sp. RTS3]|uniref:hypothetical protein n=1 Tax=Cryobacterium sp. RTS3 TaxID=3048643 RepID=UPI002B230F67|nr:hypothetical protein [Cryobacterium sp. RTS3]MEA9999651.1 hypothetical protein [Cryobacterium sp. RTS3]